MGCYVAVQFVTALSYGFYTKEVAVKDSCIRQTNLITNYMKLLMYEFGAIVFSASNFEQDFLLENFRFSMMNICLKFNATFP